ncbi:T-cell surface glycoprotein CD1b-like [Tupaia chinensis]|uniref:T-cell surface glycoprotein CD1b-like n=1 Tax=Tupaia chinensis TaxID=246437 RepID=UPI0003C90747|nr:T-cell surface glycoprotein CD1b-like [Tupaia chinensis]
MNSPDSRSPMIMKQKTLPPFACIRSRPLPHKLRAQAVWVSCSLMTGSVSWHHLLPVALVSRKVQQGGAEEPPGAIPLPLLCFTLCLYSDPAVYTEGLTRTRLFTPLNVSSCSGSMEELSPLDLLPTVPSLRLSLCQPAFQGPTSYHIIKMASFVNSSWAQIQGSGWLGDLQIHGWDRDADTVTLLKPWSKGNFSGEEFTEFVKLVRFYFVRFFQEIQKRTSGSEKYPFEVQGIAGCELRPGGATESFLRTAVGGLEFLSFQNDTCTPSPEGGRLAQEVCTLINLFPNTFKIVRKLLYETCPRYLLGVLDAGKVDLQRQVKPQAWLSSGARPGPGRLLLVCHVSGFYPKPRWVMWMRGEQEQPGTQQGDVLPNADWTWYVRVTLDIAAGEEAGLSCRVKHSSLGGQDINLHWGHPISTGMIFLATIVTCLVILLFLALWFVKRR